MTEIKQRSRGAVKPEYYTEKAKLEKNAEKDKCIICHKPVGKGLRKYCSRECFNEWYAKFSPPRFWPEIRQKAIERDGHKCVRCGMKEGEMVGPEDGFHEYVFFIVDHIEPIALGGEEFDINNLQTLCQRCNKIKTRGDMKRIAFQRRKIKLEEKHEANVNIRDFL